MHQTMMKKIVSLNGYVRHHAWNYLLSPNFFFFLIILFLGIFVVFCRFVLFCFLYGFVCVCLFVFWGEGLDYKVTGTSCTAYCSDVIFTLDLTSKLFLSQRLPPFMVAVYNSVNFISFILIIAGG